MKRKKKRARLPWRYALLAIPVVVVGGVLGASYYLLQGIARKQQVAEEASAQSLLVEKQRDAQRLMLSLVRQRSKEREAAHARLEQTAVTLAGEVQVFLQAALIERRSMMMRQRNEELSKRLTEFQSATSMLAEVATFAHKSNLALRERILELEDSDAAKRDHTVLSGPELSETRIKTDHEEGQADLLSDASEKEDALPALEPLPQDALALLHKEYDAFKPKPDWPKLLLRQCGLDIESFLPTDGTVSITEVGGGVLLHLGPDEPAAQTLSADASRALLFEGESAHVNWAIHVKLSMPDAPNAPTPIEFAHLLSEQLRFDTDSIRLDGFIYDEKGSLAAIFPDASRVQSTPPTATGAWLSRTKGVKVRYEVIRVAQHTPLQLGLLLQLPDPDMDTRIASLLEEQPAYAVGILALLVGALLLSVGCVYLFWPRPAPSSLKLVRQPTHAPDRSPVTVVDLDRGTGPITPVMGSLNRLQAENRGHSRGGSRILDHARSSVLRALVKEVRGESTPPPESQPQRKRPAKKRASYV